MGLPMVVKASFLLSGMLGLRLGIGGGKGNIETQVPFNLTLENQTATIELPPGVTVGNGSTSNVLNETTLSPFRVTRQARTLTLPGFGIKTSYDFALNGKCGPGRCDEKSQMCVTWAKEGRKGRDSPLLIHQCLAKDGDFHTKINPLGEGLCPHGQTHTVLRDPQPCLNEVPPCPLVWKYRCLNITEARDGEIHSCRYKNCESSNCVEVTECDEEPPCITFAACQ